jgi:hypothetical protein
MLTVLRWLLLLYCGYRRVWARDFTRDHPIPAETWVRWRGRVCNVCCCSRSNRTYLLDRYPGHAGYVHLDAAWDDVVPVYRTGWQHKDTLKAIATGTWEG